MPGLLCLALLCLLAFPALAKSDQTQKDKSGTGKNANNKNAPTLVQADKMTYDENTNIITAVGHAEVAQNNQILHADKIIYDQNNDIVRAEGHVALLKPSGEVMFAKEAELTSDMKDGFVEKVSELFPDNSRLTAQDAQRYEGRYLVADRGVYTACNLCVENPEKPPLWQLKGMRITHDEETHDIIYRDATVEFDGVPVFYSPFFSNPDSTVKRRQGFLSPSGGYSPTLGTFARVPYYFDIAPNSDAVITPTFTADDGVQLAGEFRHRFDQGTMQWSGSFTRSDLINDVGVDKGQQWRGNLFGSSLFNFNNEWRAGTDVALSSDKSYMQIYKISSEDELVNRAYLEGFRGRDYAASNLYYFEDLRPGAQITEPLVTPDMSFSALGEPGKTFGGRWSLDGGLLVTNRNNSGVNPMLQGPDTRRLALDAGWERQLISSTGFLTTVSGQTRVDSYWADNVPNSNVPLGSGFSDITDTRPFAQASVNVRYPFGRRGDGYQQTVEPIAVLAVAPQVSNKNLPNEDSQDVEFDETNLFASNRYSGIDRIEGGTNAGYGLRQTLIGDNGARIEVLGGQVYQFNQGNDFPGSSGLSDQLSDYVGRVDFSPGSWFDANYGFRLDHNDFEFQRQELQASAGVPLFRPSVNYLFVKQANLIIANPTSSTSGTSYIGPVEEGTIGFTSTFSKYWMLSASHRQAFQPDPGARSSTAGLTYQDECFQIGITVTRDETNRLDIQSGTSVLFHFYLKNVGGLHTDSVTSGAFTPSLPQTPLTPVQNLVQP
jgi:LPS-assembly protein